MKGETLDLIGAVAASFPSKWVLLDHAIHIAAGAHHKQVDKGGAPYLWHVLRVGIPLLPDVDAAVVGVLHDVIEDGGHYWSRQLELSMPAKIVDAVQLLTRGDGDDYLEYIRSIGQDPLATKVKLADLANNLRQDRLDAAVAAGLDPEAMQRIRERYLTARFELEKANTLRRCGERVGRDG
jgi:(p)ppGpp synthase/HD superfamily hydrolase